MSCVRLLYRQGELCDRGAYFVLLGDMFRHGWAFVGEGEEWGTRARTLVWSAVPSWTLLCGSGGGGMASVRTVREKHQQSFLEDEEGGRAAAGAPGTPLGQALRGSCGLRPPCRAAPSTFL